MFHGRYAKLAARCSAHLGGQADLYPQPMPSLRKRIPVPSGEPNLKWGKSDGKAVVVKNGVGIVTP